MFAVFNYYLHRLNLHTCKFFRFVFCACGSVPSLSPCPKFRLDFSCGLLMFLLPVVLVSHICFTILLGCILCSLVVVSQDLLFFVHFLPGFSSVTPLPFLRYFISTFSTFLVIFWGTIQDSDSYVNIGPNI